MDTSQTFLGLIGLAALVTVALWVRKDAIKRGMSPYWGIAVSGALIISFPLYFVLRKPMRCLVCGTKTKTSASVCVNCE